VKSPTRRCFAACTAIAVVFALLAGGASAEEATANASVLVPDRILVLKSERKLFLMAGDAIVKTVDISLGLMPEGPKRREGDFKTPEGTYYLESKNSSSDYFLSLKVSYPSPDDRARARQMGVDPGGMIMIHGLPNVPKYDEGMYAGWDWTDGCIAVSNSDMVDLWRLTSVSMPIEIQP
jgi:murein L,D-transpeptidase YafK